jgi:hypothetical protein
VQVKGEDLVVVRDRIELPTFRFSRTLCRLSYLTWLGL